jgi:hypothetical protein
MLAEGKAELRVDRAQQEEVGVGGKREVEDIKIHWFDWYLSSNDTRRGRGEDKDYEGTEWLL